MLVLRRVLTCNQVMLQHSCSLCCAELLGNAALQYEQIHGFTVHEQETKLAVFLSTSPQMQ